MVTTQRFKALSFYLITHRSRNKDDLFKLFYLSRKIWLLTRAEFARTSQADTQFIWCGPFVERMTSLSAFAIETTKVKIREITENTVLPRLAWPGRHFHRPLPKIFHLRCGASKFRRLGKRSPDPGHTL
jgi:hypothetical protein